MSATRLNGINIGGVRFESSEGAFNMATIEKHVMRIDAPWL
jgi:hypothetical protein